MLDRNERILISKIFSLVIVLDGSREDLEIVIPENTVNDNYLAGMVNLIDGLAG